MNQQELLKKIKSSKKYSTLNDSTINRIISDTVKRYPEKQLETQVKSKLHQIWGAYYTTRPNFSKLLKKISEQKTIGYSNEEILQPLLQIHSSTAERLSLLNDFYPKIFPITGTPTSIIDYACGLNPLALPWMHLPATTHYTAYDIDKEEVTFINNVFQLLQLSTEAEAKVGDIFDYQDESADIIFLLKFLPNIEQQHKGASATILQNLKAKYLVVSFPIKSLGGQEKGMQQNYESQIESILKAQPWSFDKLLYPTELVYVIKKTS
jgi:16S rRNA (guanine(1405)-N(7))-methyltransferase